MGQLEVYNINEIYLNGLMISIFISYLSEEQESNTFESFKAYIYSANYPALKFTLKIGKLVLPDQGIQKRLSVISALDIKQMTKTIDDLVI
jgi:hypothetical protein